MNNKRSTRVSTKSFLYCGSMAVMFTALGLSMPASAQVFEDEIIVTATKRATSIQDVGIAVTALSGDQLEALGYGNAQDVTNMTPGVNTVQPNGEANYALAIRGAAQPDFVANQESPVSMYVDEVYISQNSGAGFMLFDTERVEILRGPQGTLFGRNATGGLAHFVTKKPTQEFEGYGKFTVGSYGQIKTEGAVSGGIADGISARVSVATHQNDGYVENRFTGDKLNNANDFAARGQLLIEPSDDLSLLLNVRGGKQDIRTGFFENVFTEGVPGTTFGALNPGGGADVFGYTDPDGNNDVYAGDYDRQGHNKLDTMGYSGTLKYNFANGMKLTSITDYQTVKRDYVEDSDAGTTDGFNFTLNTDANQFSQEVRLEGDSDRMKWVAGVYYLDIGIDDANGAEVGFYNVAFGLPLGANGELFGIDNPYSQDKESISLFAQVDYKLSDQWTVVGGLRYISDKVDHLYSPSYVFIPALIDARTEDTRNGNPNRHDFQPADFLLFPDGNPVAPYAGVYDEGLWAWRASVNYEPENSRNLYYASYNRGVKGGGFNSPLDIAESLNALQRGQIDSTVADFQAEKVDAFEVGAKLSLADSVRLNLSAYYNVYDNYQAFNINFLDTRVFDSTAESKGFEAELQASLGSGLDVLLGLSYNDTGIEVPAVLSVDGTSEVVAAFATTPVQSPKWNISGLVRKAFDIGGGEMAAQADFYYKSEHFFSLNGAQGAAASTEDGYAVFNARLSYSPDNIPVEIAGFVNNLTGEEYLVNTFDLGAGFNFTEQYYGRPRWWGASIKYDFGG